MFEPSSATAKTSSITIFIRRCLENLEGFAVEGTPVPWQWRYWELLLLDFVCVLVTLVWLKKQVSKTLSSSCLSRSEALKFCGSSSQEKIIAQFNFFLPFGSVYKKVSLYSSRKILIFTSDSYNGEASNGSHIARL